MVRMSYWPPPVAMSVVTRSRRMFSSSVTQLTVMSGCAALNSEVSPCIRIMSPLFTVAMVIAWAFAIAAKARADAAPKRREICRMIPPLAPESGKYCLLGQMIATKLRGVNAGMSIGPTSGQKPNFQSLATER